MQQQTDRLRDLCLKLAKDAERWIAELRLHGIRPTLGHGMMLKCSAHVEQIIRQCSQIFLDVTGEEGARILKNIHSAARIEKLTLGQMIRFLTAIVPLLKSMGVLDEVDDQTWAQLDVARQMRNAFMHAREVREDASLWIVYLEASKALCQRRLLHVAMEVQEREAHR
jgi:hypothetical protein